MLYLRLINNQRNDFFFPLVHFKGLDMDINHLLKEKVAMRWCDMVHRLLWKTPVYLLAAINRLSVLKHNINEYSLCT